MLANKTLINMKYVREIMEFSKITSISTNDVLRIFYHSDLYFLLKNGISDIYCMSDNWLVEKLKEECENKNMSKYVGTRVNLGVFFMIFFEK